MSTHTSRRGAATIELVMAFPFLVALLVCVFGVGQGAILKTNTTVKSRHKAWAQRTVKPAGTAFSAKESSSEVRLVSLTTNSLTLVQSSSGAKPLSLKGAKQDAASGLKNGAEQASGFFVPGLNWGQMTAHSATSVLGGTWDAEQVPDSQFQFGGLGSSGQFDSLVDLLSSNGSGPSVDLAEFAFKGILSGLADEMLSQTGGSTGGQTVSFADAEKALDLITNLDDKLADWVSGFGDKFEAILDKAGDVVDPTDNPLDKPGQIADLVDSIREFGDHLTDPTAMKELDEAKALTNKYGQQGPMFDGGSPLSIDKVIPSSVGDVVKMIAGGGPFASAGSFFDSFGQLNKIPELISQLGKLDEAFENLNQEPAP